MDWSWVTADFLNGIGVVGLCVLVLLLVIFGKGLALMREVKNRDETIAWQRAAMVEKDTQIANKDELIRDLMGGAKVTTDSLRKIAQSAEQMAGGEAG